MNSEQTPASPSDDAIVAKYIATRDEIQAKQAEIKALEERLDTIEAWFSHSMLESKTTSNKYTTGTVTRRVSTRYIAQDMTAFLDHVRATGHIELLEQRVSQATIKDMLERGATAPPGVFAQQKESIVITRPRA